MKFKSKNLIWIILLSFATYVACVHTNCDRPPHLENGWTKPLVEDDNGDLVSVTYVCNDGFILQGESELLCNLDTDEWQGEPPTCNSDQTSTERNSKKINIHDIPEDTSIDSEFAKSLDRSCFIEPRIMPPEIENAVVRNLRRQKDGRIFPVAVYTCDEDYELESVDNDRLYCSKRKWIGIYPNCMQLEETYDENGEEEEEEDEDYDNNNGDEDDGDEGEEEDAEEDETEDGNEDTEDRPDEIDNDINNNEIDNNDIDNNEIDNNDIDNNEINEIEGTHKDDRDKPETDPSTVTCSDNQGGCDHKCNVIDNRIQCECFAGFKLDVDDGRTCHDINECDNDNGGCESICINQPGSFKCDCEKGLQIDTVGRTKCLDINECLLRNGHGPCQDTCINTFGGYRCSCENLPGTKLAKNGRNCEDAGKCAIRNGGCSQGCVSAAGRIYCLCERGYYLESDRKTCQDIDECADPEISAQCPHGCENTPGSYRCKEDTTIAPPSNIIEGEEDNNVESSNVLEAEDVHENEINISLDEDEREDNEDDDENEDENDRDDNNEQDNEIYDQNILKTCGDGYELDENNRCVDIDECAQGNTGCEFCKNVNGGFECFCPDGFDIADDERTCLDIDECEMESDYDVTDDQETYAQSPCSHECVNTHGSYLCLCPDNFHLQYDHRTCIRDFCEHLTDELNKTKCSHQCHDEKDGYVCSCPPGLQLDTDSKTCLVNNNQCEQENHCSPGVCINTNDGYRCECPSGYIEKAKRCHDENECEIGNHHCSHECRNLDGSYECHCPSGYILAADRRTCQDVDECERDDEGDLCGDMDCINTVGSYKCQCPEGEELITVESGSICREIDLCDSETNGGCSHGCKTEQSEVQCYCPDGMKLHADGKHCGKLNKCEIRNGDCSQVCNSEAEVCECHPGFELSDDEKTCVDVNECERENGGCSHICNNLLGSYQCSCPNEGQYLVNDEKTCEFVNECEINNGGCSHKCEYKSGTTRCVCPPGYQFQNGSTKSCEDINECQTNNGGCSYQCKNYEGRHECLCKAGYELGRDKKNCIDVDECIDFNGNCTNICLNLIGSYQCACETGFQLFDDQHTCIDINECEESLNDCSHECVNVPGTYECSCPNGYTLAVDHFTCEDINECDTIADCSHGCINEEGSYHCTCNDGHMLHSDNKTCIDIDECHDNSICSHGCVNSIGGFECHCPNGLELDDDSRTCKDINECQLANGNCSHNCENVEGSYRCLCPSGFQLDSDGVTCVDIDECAVRNGDCEHVCTNYDGGHRCDCLDGFMIKEDGRRCDSKDLCIKANGGCEHICKTVDDLIQCDCRNGFKLNAADNTSCVDINECESSHGCQHDCVNVIGSYKCKCRSGHRMNDKGQCIDIDECQYFNGGCSIMAKCINLVGGFRCHCPVGYKLGHDKKTCVEIRDHCQPLSKPKNGEIKCFRSRHRTQLFYKTKCTITCQPGFVLIGDEFRQCNGTGHWDQGSSICAPKLCPRLQRPSHGTLTPANCMTGDTFSGQRCVLHCDPGFKPIDRRTAFCEPPKNWLPNPNLNCMPAVAKLEMIRPYIKCPQDSIILLPHGKKTIHVKLQQPNTNVDWWKYVDSHPPWGKKLEAHLTPGIHTILFKARSPNSNLNDVCRTIITVKETHPPTVVFCPESTVEHLQPNEDSRSIYFKEPVFKSEHIKEVYKSKLPGEKFGPGEHVIRYVATDLDDQSTKCEFTISVKPYYRRIIHHNEVIKAKPLANHESYVKCPGKPAVKIDTNFPINLSRGCLIKNIRIPAYSHIRRRHHPSSSNSVLRHYSSWDNPDKPASFIHQYRRGWD